MSGMSSPPDGDRTRPIPIADETLAALEWFAEETRETYVRMARDRIRRLRIDAIELAAEGAVQAAWVVLCKRLQEGKIELLLTRDQFDKIFRPLLRHILSDERRRQSAGKRARSRTVHLSALEEAGFDAIDHKASAPEEHASGEEQGHSLVELLGSEDESLRAIALLKMEGLTNEEIASRLDKLIWYVKRKLDRIRTILGPHRNVRV